jgi:hypothetical protein
MKFLPGLATTYLFVCTLALGRWQAGVAGAADADHKRVITAADLKYLGVMKAPLDIMPGTQDPWLSRAQGALALRTRPDGSKSLLVCGPTVRYRNPLVEISIEGFNTDPEQAVRGKFLNGWKADDWQQGCKTWGKIPFTGYLETAGMLWEKDTLYSVFGGTYDVSGGDKPVLMMTKFHEDGTLKSYGPWHIAAGTKQTRNYLVRVPDWYAQQHLGGNTFAAGATLNAGDGSSPWPRSLISLPWPAPTLPPTSTIPSKTMLFYPMNHPDIYPAPYRSAVVKKPLTRGPWINNGVVPSAVWIDTPALTGVLYFGRIGKDYVWYGQNPDPKTGITDRVNLSKGYHAENYQQYLAIDNPLKYLGVLGGKAPSWSVTANATVDLDTLPGVKLPEGAMFTGAVFDPTTSTLILCGDAEQVGFNPMALFRAFHVGP